MYKIFYQGREKIIDGFKDKISPIYHDDKYGRFKDDDEIDIRDRNGLIVNEKLKRLTHLKRRNINDELFREYFKYQDLSYMVQNLNCTKNKERNKIQVNLIKRALTDLKNKIKNMSENKTEFEQPNEIVNIVEKIQRGF